jgi:hypothetical protein
MKPENPLLKSLEALAFRPVGELEASGDRYRRSLDQALEAQGVPEPAEPQDRGDSVPPRRPADSRGLPGGLVNLDPRLPTLVLPDLHTRRRAFFQILSRPLADSGETVLQALEAGRLNLVCVGDALHSEGPGAPAHWRAVWEEAFRGYRPSPEMDREMNAGMALQEMIFLLQTRVPGNFFFLKGNHENITCEEGRGNHPFGKYAAEGEMVFGYLEHRFGNDMIKELYRWEHALPLMARGPWYLISHAEPRRAFSSEEVIDAARRPEVVEGLTWTRRWEAEESAVQDTLARFLSPWLAGRALYWAGHTALAEPVWYGEENLVLFHGSGPLKGWVLPPEPPDQPDSGDLDGLFQTVSADEGSGS